MYLRLFSRFAAITASVFALTSLGLGQQVLRVTMESPEGEWIGDGQNWDLTYTDFNTEFLDVDLFISGSGSLPNFLRFSAMHIPSSTNYFTGDFSTHQIGHELRPGTYLDAERATFASPGHPGLNINFQHRGSNVIEGSFVINSIAYHHNGTEWRLDSFDASFVQHSEGGPLALTGTINYMVPEPASCLALVGGIAMVMRRRKYS